MKKHAAAGIGGVTVELDGTERPRTAATDPDGRFRFEGVRTGGYTLRVLGRGYRPRAQYVWVDEDVALILPLAPAPVSEEASRRARRRSWGGSGPPDARGVRGVVREGEWGLPLRGAEILTNRGVATRTGKHGGFDLVEVPPGASVLVSVRAFGYLPLDTVVVAGGGTEYDFQLWRDPAVQRRIRSAMEALTMRARRHPGSVRTLGREALLASHESSVEASVRSKHGELVQTVGCVILDEAGGYGPDLLSRLAPGDLQRVEILLDPGGTGDAVARVYSRDFVRDLVAGSVDVPGSSAADLEEPLC